MKKTLLVLLGLLFLSAGNARAEEKPFNLALVYPVQVFDASHDISGFRFNLIYGRNSNVKGLDLGIGLGQSDKNFSGVGLHYAANFVRGNARGLQLADGVNIDLEDFSGVQFAAVNYTKGNTAGFQLSYASITQGDFAGIAIGGANIVLGNAHGFKLAIFNFARHDFSGLQIGLVNIGGLKNGLQIGLVNINRNKKPLPFFPFFNFSF